MIPLIEGPAHLICMWRFTCDVTSSVFLFFLLFFFFKWVGKKAPLIHCLTLCYPPSSIFFLPIYCTPTAPWKERKDTDRISNTAGAWTPETVKECEHRSEVTLGCLVGLSFLSSLFNCIRFLCFQINLSAFPAFKNDEKLHNACWMKNTVAIVCSTQKDGDDALLKASVYVRLQFTNLEMCGFFFLIYLHCYCLFSFYRWSDSENSARLIVAAAFTVITIGAIVSHWKAVFKWWNSDFSRWLSEIKKEAL